MIVLDTSALLFWTLNPERLSETAGLAIAGTDQIGISSISIWEIGLKVNKGRLSIPLSIGEFVNGLAQVDRVVIFPVDTATWLKNLELRWEHRDPADRTIVATAFLYSCPLVTSDATIQSFYSNTIW